MVHKQSAKCPDVFGNVQKLEALSRFGRYFVSCVGSRKRFHIRLRLLDSADDIRGPVLYCRSVTFALKHVNPWLLSDIGAVYTVRYDIMRRGNLQPMKHGIQ